MTPTDRTIALLATLAERHPSTFAPCYHINRDFYSRPLVAKIAAAILAAEQEALATAEARIARLEEALLAADLPSADRSCQCCGAVYVPQCLTSIRCWQCCEGCIYRLGDWRRGHLCPANERTDKE